MWIDVVHGCPFVYIRQYLPRAYHKTASFESFCGDRLGIPFKVNLGDQLKSISEINANFRESTGARSVLTRSIAIAATVQQLH
jgi:hypothetical protein